MQTTCRTCFGLLVLFCSFSVRAITVYSPSALASTEGDVNNGLPFNLGYFDMPSSRYQQVYAASQFSGLPAGGGMLTQIAFRIDATGASFSTTLPDIQIDFCTTGATVDGLSTTFAANIGADNTIVVHRGPLAISGTKSGAVSPFNVVINLDTPFFYNPALGNLLMDVHNFGGGLTTQFDASTSITDGTSRAFTWMGTDVNSPNGYGTDSLALVTQFNFVPVPEPSAVSLLAIGISGGALLRLRRR